MKIADFLEEHKDEYETPKELVAACVKAMGRTRKSVENVYRELYKTMHVSGKRPKKRIRIKKEHKGVEGFRQMFSRAEVQKRKTQKVHQKIADIIDGVLRERVWIPDQELREMVGVSGVEWSNLRRDFEHLIITDVVDENKRRYTIWAHPDHVEELRDIVNE